MTFKKGQRVGWHTDGKLVFSSAREGVSHVAAGVVYRRQAKHPRINGAALIVEVKEGHVLTIPEDWAIEAPALPPEEPTAMDRYSVTGYKTMRGHGDSDCFECTIRKAQSGTQGVPIARAFNSGHGGSNEYHPSNPGNYTGAIARGPIQELHKAAKAWAETLGYGDMLEPLDFWLSWFQFERPLGITAREAVQKLKAEIDGFKKGAE